MVTLRKEGSLLFLKFSIHKGDVHVDGEGMPTLVLPSSAEEDKPIIQNRSFSKVSCFLDMFSQQIVFLAVQDKSSYRNASDDRGSIQAVL